MDLKHYGFISSSGFSLFFCSFTFIKSKMSFNFLSRESNDLHSLSVFVYLSHIAMDNAEVRSMPMLKNHLLNDYI